jgi:xanthine dehydrogenase YagR molybdenum-binding subunit
VDRSLDFPRDHRRLRRGAGGSIAGKLDASRAVPIAEAMRRGGVDRIEREKSNTPGKEDTHARSTHSAVFVEVRIDEQIGIIRVHRIVSAIAAGRIVNAKTARSQILGSVVMGVGMALHEEAVTDHKFGRIVNANFAEYAVPVHADIHDIEVIFVDEPDSLINPLGIKGVGEIGIVGVAAAVANAVYHATGKRIRDLPITLDKLRR